MGRVATNRALLEAVESLTRAYCQAYGFKDVRPVSVNRSGPDIHLTRGKVRVSGRLSAPHTLIGTFVAKCNRTTLAGRPLVRSAGTSLVIAARRPLYAAAEALFDIGQRDEAELLLYFAVNEALLHEDDDVAVRPELLAQARKKPALTEEMSGTHLSVLRRLVPWTKKSKLLDRVRAFCAIKTVLEDAHSSNELHVEALVGSALLYAVHRGAPAERDAALGALKALTSMLALGRAFREVERYASALIEAGRDSDLALLHRLKARAVSLDSRANDDARELLRFSRDPHRAGVFQSSDFVTQTLAAARVDATRNLLVFAKGKDPCLRRLKASIEKPTREKKRELLEGARCQLLLAAQTDIQDQRVATELHELTGEVASLLQ